MLHPAYHPEPSPIARRAFLAGTAALTVAADAPDIGLSVAGPPRRFGRGDFQIDVFSDGFITLSDAIIAPDAGPSERADIVDFHAELTRDFRRELTHL